jgi:hypothetical protein
MPAVAWTSRPSPAPEMRLRPPARAASSSALCEMDLSPGSLGSPRRRAAFETDRDGSPGSGEAATGR